MIHELNALIALVALSAIVCRLARASPAAATNQPRILHHAWLTAHVALAVGLAGIITAGAFGLPPHPAAGPSLLAGLALLLLPRWRRRSEDRTP